MVTWNGEQEFWRVAARSIPLWTWLLGRSVTPEQVEVELGASPEWQQLKKHLQAGDRIWPFEFNRKTLAYRKGFVVMRAGKPIGGVVTVLS